MTTTRNAPARREDKRLAKKTNDDFKPGKGGQLSCLVRPLYRIEGLLANPVKRGDLDSEYDYLEYVWTQEKMQQLKEALDAEKAGRDTDYKWKRSSLLFVIVVALVLGTTVSEAHRRVRTDARLRRLGGFPPRPPRRERRKFNGDETDPNFPSHGMIDDLVVRWAGGRKKAHAQASNPVLEGRPETISERGLSLLAFMEKLAQEVAFDGILEYDLDCSRLVTDQSVVLSGHRRPNPYRNDEGAEMFKTRHEVNDEKAQAKLGRMLANGALVGSGFLITSDITKHQEGGGEPGALKNVVLPGLAEASRRLVEYAQQRGYEGHKGFHGAVVCGDAAFNNHPCIEATFNHGFLAAYNVGGDDVKKLRGTRKLAARRTRTRADGTVEVEKKDKIVSLRNDGALLCQCPGSTAKKYPPMARKIIERYRKARVHCPECGWTYFTTPRNQDVVRGGRRKEGGINLRFDITLPRWDERVVAMCFKARNEIEAIHGELRSMGLIPDGRGGESWRSITGEFRHLFWYRLGHLLWNIRVAFNLAQTEEQQEYGYAEGRDAYHRNRHKIKHQAELAARRAARAAEENVRRRKAAKYARSKRSRKLTRRMPPRPAGHELAQALRDRAAAFNSG
jgi:hypothetical protein